MDSAALTEIDGKRYYRRKRKEKLVLPVNSAAVKLLRRLKRHQEENGGLRRFVFSHDLSLIAVSEDYHPSQTWARAEKSKWGQSPFRYGGGKPLRHNAVEHFFKNSMGIKDYDLYGFRGSFKQFQIDQKIKMTQGDPELAGEAVLHHKIGGVARNSYAQGAVPYDAMQELMDLWGAHCESELKKHRRQKLKVVR